MCWSFFWWYPKINYCNIIGIIYLVRLGWATHPMITTADTSHLTCPCFRHDSIHQSASNHHQPPSAHLRMSILRSWVRLPQHRCRLVDMDLLWSAYIWLTPLWQLSTIWCYAQNGFVASSQLFKPCSHPITPVNMAMWSIAKGENDIRPPFSTSVHGAPSMPQSEMPANIALATESLRPLHDSQFKIISDHHLSPSKSPIASYCPVSS